REVDQDREDRGEDRQTDLQHACFVLALLRVVETDRDADDAKQEWRQKKRRHNADPAGSDRPIELRMRHFAPDIVEKNLRRTDWGRRPRRYASRVLTGNQKFACLLLLPGLELVPVF